MNEENYSSNSDDSDDDYCPETEENLPSEIDDIENEDDEKNTIENIRKRKKLPIKGKRKNRKIEESDAEDDIPEVATNLTEEEEKKKADALWADFLGNSHTESKVTSVIKNVNCHGNEPKKSTTSKLEPKETKKVTITEIFEFAGEKVKVTKDVPADSVAARLQDNSNNSNATTSLKGKSNTIGSARPNLGIGALLGKIDKRNKISTLEKTKLDWDSFKKNEGIDEELQTHNKGKDGYLERQDFLERTDLRQFDIEKDFRTTKRSTR